MQRSPPYQRQFNFVAILCNFDPRHRHLGSWRFGQDLIAENQMPSSCFTATWSPPAELWKIAGEWRQPEKPLGLEETCQEIGEFQDVFFFSSFPDLFLLQSVVSSLCNIMYPWSRATLGQHFAWCLLWYAVTSGWSWGVMPGVPPTSTWGSNIVSAALSRSKIPRPSRRWNRDVFLGIKVHVLTRRDAVLFGAAKTVLGLCCEVSLAMKSTKILKLQHLAQVASMKAAWNGGIAWCSQQQIQYDITTVDQTIGLSQQTSTTRKSSINLQHTSRNFKEKQKKWNSTKFESRSGKSNHINFKNICVSPLPKVSIWCHANLCASRGVGTGQGPLDAGHVYGGGGRRRGDDVVQLRAGWCRRRHFCTDRKGGPSPMVPQISTISIWWTIDQRCIEM